jgi:hypothetical protein
MFTTLQSCSRHLVCDSAKVLTKVDLAVEKGFSLGRISGKFPVKYGFGGFVKIVFAASKIYFR